VRAWSNGIVSSSAACPRYAEGVLVYLDLSLRVPHRPAADPPWMKLSSR
jgi:hypothetical protein